jgi:hypothetical protein
MKSIIEEIASRILGAYPQVKQIRSVGYLSKAQDSNYVYNEELEEIGLTDRMGNSGYVRFRSDNNLQGTKTERFGPVMTTYNVPLRLVLMMEQENNASTSLLTVARIVNNIYIQQHGELQTITCEYIGGGSNTKANHLAETGKEITNNNYRIIYADFNVNFLAGEVCSITPNEMNNQCNCTSVLSLGCAPSCDDVTIELDVETGDEVIMSTMFNGSTVEARIEVTESGKVTVPSGTLNEDYLFKLEFYRGVDQLTKEVEGTTYNCFEIKINP